MCSAVWPTRSICFPSFLVPSPPGARPFGFSARVSTVPSSPAPAGELADEVAERDRPDHALTGVLLDVGRRRAVQRRELPPGLLYLRPHARADLARRLLDLVGHLHDVTSSSKRGLRGCDSPTETPAASPRPESGLDATRPSHASSSGARPRRAGRSRTARPVRAIARRRPRRVRPPR